MKLLFICTAKGLLIYTFTKTGDIAFHSHHFTGFSVNVIFIDERSGRWWAGVSHKHWGQKLHFSEDKAKSWHQAAMPTLSGERMPDGKPARLRQIWSMEGGGKEKRGVIWMGTDPGALFKSENDGESFELVRSLWEHPSRKTTGNWFGAGSDYPFIHTINVDPKDNDHIYISVSCAGVFETKDGGISWHPKNSGLTAAYLPNPHVEIGHDPHRVLMNQNRPEIIWQQNHCGVFLTRNGGEKWENVSGRGGCPEYGFTIMIDDEKPGTAWVVPVDSDAKRVPHDLRLQVFQTDDFGNSWCSVSEGLPDKNVFDIVLRQASDNSGPLKVIGTSNGNVFYSKSDKVRWKPLENNLPKVNMVKIIS